MRDAFGRTAERPREYRAGDQNGRVSKVSIARVYDDAPAAGTRVLVDRLWPRGVSKEDAPFDEWCKEVAPSPQLRTWYAHDPAKHAEFMKRYARELAEPTAREGLDHLRKLARTGQLTLLTATKNVDISHAAALADVLNRGSAPSAPSAPSASSAP